MVKKKKAKKTSEVDKVAKEIVEIATRSKKSKEISKKTKSKDKAKNKAKSKKSSEISLKEIVAYARENDFGTVLNTKTLSQMIMDLTGYRLGSDLTAAGKNLRRYLRSMDYYNDGEVTHYRWNLKEREDVEIVQEILSHYVAKSQVG